MIKTLTSLYVWRKISDVSVPLSESGFCSLQVVFLDQVGNLQSIVGLRCDHGCVVVYNGFHVFIFGIALEVLELQPVHEGLRLMMGIVECMSERKRTM